MGCRLPDLVTNGYELKSLASACADEDYLLFAYRSTKRSGQGGREASMTVNGKVGVVLHARSGPQTELKAYMHASALLEVLDQHADDPVWLTTDLLSSVEHTNPTTTYFCSVLRGLQALDWETGRVLLETGPFRAVWCGAAGGGPGGEGLSSLGSTGRDGSASREDRAFAEHTTNAAGNRHRRKADLSKRD